VTRTARSSADDRAPTGPRALLPEGRRLAYLLLGAALLLSTTLSFDFVFDDVLVILRDLEAHAGTGVADLHRPVQVQHGTLAYYRPLVTLTYRMDWLLWGENPAGYHLTNLAWHLLATLLVYRLARNALNDAGDAWLAAALFVLLPAHAEALGWVQGRVDLVSAALVLAALGALTAAWRAGGLAGWAWAGAAAFAWLLALLAKESALAFPLAAAVFALLGPGKPDARGTARLARLLPCVPALLAYLLLAGTALQGVARPQLDLSLPAHRLQALLVALGEYGRLLLLPPPSLHFFRWLPVQGNAPTLAAGGLLLAVLAGAGVACWRSARPLVAWAAWIPLSLLPAVAFGALSAPPAAGVFIAERFLYLPSAGWCILAAALLGRALRRAPGVLRPVPAALLAGYAALLLLRLQPWAGPVRHFHAVRAQEGVSRPLRVFLQSELGRTHLERGELGDARREFLAGLALQPDSPILHNHLGAVLIEEGRPTEALPWLEQALRLRPDYADARQNLRLAREGARGPAGPPERSP
jgi:tetratricopeptide (TPR) repeat protein